MAVTFTLDQKTVDTEIEKRREAKLAKLHPIFRFLRESVDPAKKMYWLRKARERGHNNVVIDIICEKGSPWAPPVFNHHRIL